MIDKPLPDQVMQEKETLQNAQDFEFLCKHHAVEIAAHYKVHPDLDEYFAEWYYNYMEQNPDLFDSCFFILDSDYIVDWWEAESYLYDDFDSPYMEITK